MAVGQNIDSDNFIAKGVWDLFNVDFGTIANAPEVLGDICRTSRKTIEMFGASSNLSATFFTDPGGKCGGFSLGVDLSLGKSLNHSLTFTEYEIWGGPWRY